MGRLTIGVEIEECHVQGGIDLTINGFSEQEDDVSPATIRLGQILNEQMRLAVIAAQTTMNEGI